MSWLEPGEEVVFREKITPATLAAKSRVPLWVTLLPILVLEGLLMWVFYLVGKALVLLLEGKEWGLAIYNGFMVVVIGLFLFYAVWECIPHSLRDYRVVHTHLIEKRFKPALALYNRRFALKFAQYGELEILPGTLYLLGSRQITGLAWYESTQMGDAYFLLLDKKGRILSAFDERYFEWVEEPVPEE